MRLYGISRHDVVQVLEKADRYAPTIKGRTNAWRAISGRQLRLTYIEEERQLVIVTVTPLEQ